MHNVKGHSLETQVTVRNTYCRFYSVTMEGWYHLVGVATPAAALSANSSWRAEMTVRMTTTEPHRNRMSRHIPLQGN